jgi:hypothetical protein
MTLLQEAMIIGAIKGALFGLAAWYAVQLIKRRIGTRKSNNNEG